MKSIKDLSRDELISLIDNIGNSTLDCCCVVCGNGTIVPMSESEKQKVSYWYMCDECSKILHNNDI